jgi:cytochrome c biogenesis protein CcdA
MRTHYEDASLGELLSDLSQQASCLVREEVELAKTELSHSAKRVGKGAGFVAAGAVMGFAGLLSLIALCIIALAVVVKLWISALIITAIVISAALILVQVGLTEIKRQDLAPKHSLQSLKEDVAWAKAQTR